MENVGDMNERQVGGTTPRATIDFRGELTEDLLPHNRRRQLLNLLAHHGVHNVMFRRNRMAHLLDPARGKDEQTGTYPASYPAAEWSCAVDGTGQA
jgi:hypothetical protein